MAVSIGTPTVSHEESAIGMNVAGLVPGHTYTLWRIYKRWDGATDVEYEPVIGWNKRRVDSTSSFIADPIAPHNRSIVYMLKDGDTEVARSSAVTMNWQKLDEDPWSLLNERPVLRDPYRATPYEAAHPDTTRPYARLVVSEFSATWPTRGQKVSIIGSRHPVVVTDQRELKEGTVTVITADYRTLKDPSKPPPWKESDWVTYPAALQRDNLLNLLQTTRLLHLRGWCVDGFQNLFLVPGDIEENVPFPQRPDIREWRISFQQVPDPTTYTLPRWAAGWGDLIDLADLVGPTGTFEDLATKAGTFEGLAAAVDPIAGPMSLAARDSREWL